MEQNLEWEVQEAPMRRLEHIMCLSTPSKKERNSPKAQSSLKNTLEISVL